jgi:hypothetical protein
MNANDCPQNVRIVGLSSKHFHVRFELGIFDHETEEIFIISLLSAFVDHLGKEFKLTIKSGLTLPTNSLSVIDKRYLENCITMHIIFPKNQWLIDVSRQISAIVATSPELVKNTIVSVLDESNPFMTPFSEYNTLAPTYHFVVKDNDYVEKKITMAHISKLTTSEYSFDTREL